jgi:uncharacterized membrane protein YeiH
MPDQFQLPAQFDYLAVVAWALSGALVGARKRFDLVGVFMTAMTSAVGGSLLRDGVLLQKTPPVLTNGVYLPLIAGTTVFAVLLARKLESATLINRAVDLIDSVGTPAFGIIGVEAALASGLPLPGVLLVGCVGGVGGGVLRDLLVRDVPEIMRPGHYHAILVAIACIAYLALTVGAGFAHAPVAWGVVAAYFMLRVATVRFDWRTRPVLPE